MSITLSPLPYSLDALEPFISKNTLEHHYLKHHRKYVDTLNELIAKTPYENRDLDEILLETVNKSGRERKIFNNAAQAWNHTFYWSCMAPSSNRASGKPSEPPSAAFKRALEAYFGSYEDFLEEFQKAGKELFGSGWVWLVKTEEGELAIRAYENAGNPLADGEIPLLVCDVWEHAYYLDQQEKRAEYCKNFCQIIHWDFVESNFRKENPNVALLKRKNPKNPPKNPSDTRFYTHH